MYINQNEMDNLNKGLRLFIEVFRPYVVSFLVNKFGDNWDEDFAENLSPKQRENWEKDLQKGIKPENLIDFQYLKKFALDNKKSLQEDFGYIAHSLPTWLSEIYEARNGVAHYDNTLEETKALKAWIHLREIAKLIGNDELEQQLSNLQKNVTPQIAQTPKNAERTTSNLTPYTTETLDIVNCSGLWQEVFAEEVYICPVGGGSRNHRQCKYFGAYFLKRVGAVGEIEAVVDVYSENETQIYWINGNDNAENYITRAKEKAIELRPNDLPARIFLLRDLYSTEFVKDSKGGMQGAKMYMNIEELKVKNAKELAEILNGRNWSEFGK